jgi:hypothetical protein
VSLSNSFLVLQLLNNSGMGAHELSLLFAGQTGTLMVLGQRHVFTIASIDWCGT